MPAPAHSIFRLAPIERRSGPEHRDPEQGGANNDIFDQATKAANLASTAMASTLQSATVQVGKASTTP